MFAWSNVSSQAAPWPTVPPQVYPIQPREGYHGETSIGYGVYPLDLSQCGQVLPPATQFFLGDESYTGTASNFFLSPPCLINGGTAVGTYGVSLQPPTFTGWWSQQTPAPLWPSTNQALSASGMVSSFRTCRVGSAADNDNHWRNRFGGDGNEAHDVLRAQQSRGSRH